MLLPMLCSKNISRCHSNGSLGLCSLPAARSTKCEHGTSTNIQTTNPFVCLQLLDLLSTEFCSSCYILYSMSVILHMLFSPNIHSPSMCLGCWRMSILFGPSSGLTCYLMFETPFLKARLSLRFVQHLWQLEMDPGSQINSISQRCVTWLVIVSLVPETTIAA